ncbi:MAG: glycosyltransferase family A protein [Bacteroidota bacterium]
MLFSIIIPTCNRNEQLGKCLSLLINQVVISDYEIIVTDDSTDDIAKQFIKKKYSFVNWVSGPKKGPAANRNNGAKHARGEWLLFLDDDIIPANNLLESYYYAIRSFDGVFAFEGAIIPDNEKLLKLDMSECPINLHGGCFWSANICIRRDVFFELDGFDEQFKFAAQEDQDFFIRFIKKYKYEFVVKAFVIHPVRFISFRNKLFGIKKGITNWYLLETKHNYQSIGRVLKTSIYLIYSHLRGCYKNLLSLKFKSTLFSFIWIFVGMPIYLYLVVQFSYHVKFNKKNE